MNSGCESPEVTALEVEDTVAVRCGSICTVSIDGYVQNTSGGKAKYLMLEDKAQGDGKTAVRAMRITDGMLFETEIGNIPTEVIKVGFVGSLAADGDGYLTQLGEGGSDLEVIRHHYTDNDNLVVVTLL